MPPQQVPECIELAYAAALLPTVSGKWQEVWDHLPVAIGFMNDYVLPINQRGDFLVLYELDSTYLLSNAVFQVDEDACFL